MDANEILKPLRAKPFEPFEMQLHDGRTLAVRHPELMLVARRVMFLAWHNKDSNGPADDWTVISPLAIASLHPIQQS